MYDNIIINIYNKRHPNFNSNFIEGLSHTHTPLKINAEQNKISYILPASDSCPPLWGQIDIYLFNLQLEILKK